jgi:hypothetical protein
MPAQGEILMTHKFALSLSIVCLALIAVVTMSCGGSSSSGGGTGGGPYNVVGIWQTTLSGSAGSTSFVGAINSQGLALLFADNPADPAFVGDTWELPTITGASSFSGMTSLYAEPGTQLPWGGTVQTISMQGNVNSATSITGKNSNGSFTLSPYSPLTRSVTAFTGAMVGEIEGGANIFRLTFAPGGSGQSMNFSGSGGFCVVTGSFTQEGTSNIFDVSMIYESGGCPGTGTVTGLGFESSSDYFQMNGNAQGTYLYANMLGSSPYVLEIFQQAQ